jgi:SAM-dependent methyltransferase
MMAASPTPPERVTRSDCPVCGAAARRLSHGEKDAWLCRRCKHSFIRTLPTEQELAAVYERYGYDGEAGRYSPALLDTIIAELVASFEPYRSTNKLLDVGFGAGGLLRVAKMRGWETHGVELSSAAVAYGRERDIGTLYEGDFLVLPLERGAFDVVVMSELVEHLVDPMPFLRRAAELLRPGGLLYMTTPHGRGVSGRALGADWSVLRPPEHLQLFSIDSMRRSVNAAGFSRVHIYTQGLLPHELVAKLRARVLPRRQGASSSSYFEDRAKRSVDFNVSISQRRVGRALKTAANALLRATSLGDSLRVRAER